MVQKHFFVVCFLFPNFIPIKCSFFHSFIHSPRLTYHSNPKHIDRLCHLAQFVSEGETIHTSISFSPHIFILCIPFCSANIYTKKRVAMLAFDFCCPKNSNVWTTGGSRILHISTERWMQNCRSCIPFVVDGSTVAVIVIAITITIIVCFPFNHWIHTYYIITITFIIIVMTRMFAFCKMCLTRSDNLILWPEFLKKKKKLTKKENGKNVYRPMTDLIVDWIYR